MQFVVMGLVLSEKVTRSHVRANRSILIPSVPVSEGTEIRHECQFVSSHVRALSKLPGGMGRFLPCGIDPHGLRHLGWSHCSHGLTSRPLESCHHQCLSAVCGVLGYPKGSAAELLDGSLKLRYCTTVFTNNSSPGFYRGWVEGLVTGVLLPLVISWIDCRGNFGKRVRLTRKTRPGAFSFVHPDPGHPTPRRRKSFLHPLPPKEWGARWASLAVFFLALGLDEVCNQGCLEPAFGGNRRREFRLVSPAEGVSALALVISARVCAYGHTFVHYTMSAPPPPPPP